MKFQEGDKVICINNKTREFDLKLYHEYKIKKINCDEFDNTFLQFDDLINNYNPNRFISIEEYRKIKINKIKNNK